LCGLLKYRKHPIDLFRFVMVKVEARIE